MIVREKDRKTNFAFFLDNDKKVLLDFTEFCNKKLMVSEVRYLCDHVTALEEKNNAYYIGDCKYLDKEETEKYVRETFNEIANGVIKARTYLCITHYGSYSTIGETYKKILTEIKEKHYKITGIPIEKYINGSWDRNSFIMKIMIPIELNLYCYATENGKMDLNDEDTLKEYKEKYKNWLSLLCKDKNPIGEDHRPSYIDPDAKNPKTKERINPQFYFDLCSFLKNQSRNEKYTYDEHSEFINGEGNVKLVSDQFGFSAPSKDKKHPYDIYLKKCMEEAIDKVMNWVMESRTIGGSFLWPNDIWESYNAYRGGSSTLHGGSYIQDRVDLTLLEIKHYLDKMDREKDVLEVKGKIGEKWFSNFSSFKDYVEYFCFDPFVDKENNYMPYDIVRSDFENDRKICLDEKQINYKNRKANSIFDLSASELERMFNNVNRMIIERSAIMTNKIVQK